MRRYKHHGSRRMMEQATPTRATTDSRSERDPTSDATSTVLPPPPTPQTVVVEIYDQVYHLRGVDPAAPRAAGRDGRRQDARGLGARRHGRLPACRRPRRAQHRRRARHPARALRPSRRHHRDLADHHAQPRRTRSPACWTRSSTAASPSDSRMTAKSSTSTNVSPADQTWQKHSVRYLIPQA